MHFSMKHKIFEKRGAIIFEEQHAPDWLRYGGPEGSTMDNRWFWNDHVMKLEIGQSVETDFHVITRIR